MSKEIKLGKEIVNFIGPEGSGKSTAAKGLSELSGKPYVSVGDILRYMAANDETPLGDECRDMFANHRYMEPSALLRILSQGFKRKEYEDGFILDGGLRTVEETLGFWEMLEEADRKMDMTVIHIRIPGWLGAERLTGENGRGRVDDTVDGVLSRMSNFYKDLGIRASIIRAQEGCTLIHIDSLGTKEETLEKVCKALKKRKK